MKLINPHAEIQVLLTVLDSSSNEVKTTCLSKLKPSLFGHHATEQAYNRICTLVQSKGSIPPKSVFLNDGAISDETRTILSTEANQPVHNLDDLNHLLSVLNDYRQVRIAYGAGKGISAQIGKEIADIGSLKSIMEQSLVEMRESDDELNKLYHVGVGGNSEQVIRNILNPSNTQAIPTTFDNFDKTTKGWRKGNCICIASHYKGGKSIVKTNILVNQFLKHNLNVCDLTLEMDEEESWERVASKLTKISYDKIHTNQLDMDESEKVYNSWRLLEKHGIKNNCRFTIFPTAGKKISELEVLLKPFNYDVIAIDYVNLLCSEEGPSKLVDAAQLSAYFKDLKTMAKRLNCLIIALTQMDINTGDLRYSKSAKEHCNNVWVWSYDEAAMTSHVIKVKQLAARSHKPFSFYLREEFDTMTVSDHDGPVFEEESEEKVEQRNKFKNNGYKDKNSGYQEK